MEKLDKYDEELNLSMKRKITQSQFKSKED